MPENVTLLLLDEHRRERLDVDINARLVSVQVSTAINRGFDQLNIGIAPRSDVRREGVTYGQLPEPIDIRPFARAELRIGGYTAFEGRLMPTNVPATRLTVRGDWDALATDDWFASTDTTEDSAGEVVKTMLAASVLRVRPGDSTQFRDPQVTHAPSEFDGRTVNDALTQIVNEGDALGNSVDWYIWEDRRLWLLPRVEPSEPDYRFDLDPATMQVFCDPSNMLSGLVVEYTISASGTATITSGNTSVTVTHGLGVTPDASRVRFFANNNPTNDPGNAWVDTIGSTTFAINVRNDPGASGASFAWFAEVPGQRTDEASNADFYREFGFQRRQKVNVGKMTQAAAERIRDRILVDAKRPRYSARVRVDPGAMLRGPRNEPIAKHVARAGQWGRIADLPMLMAVSTRLDVTGDQLDIDFGERLPTLGEQIRRLQLSEERRRRNIEPESGGAIA